MILGAGASKTVFRNYGSPPSELAEKPTFREVWSQLPSYAWACGPPIGMKIVIDS
jgi:hypothetical protein